MALGNHPKGLFLQKNPQKWSNFLAARSGIFTSELFKQDRWK